MTNEVDCQLQLQLQKQDVSKGEKKKTQPPIGKFIRANHRTLENFLGQIPSIQFSFVSISVPAFQQSVVLISLLRAETSTF